MRIVHIFRAPVGGLFRHVRELAAAQAEAGHEVGLICDSLTGGDQAEEQLAALAPRMSLGIERLPMPRLPSPSDLRDLMRIRQHLARLAPDIVHGHGAKGGLHARLAARQAGGRAVYTAHGGSLHYSWHSPVGAAFLATERLLLSWTDGLVFVCDFERRAFEARIGRMQCPWAVVHNGLPESDFGYVPPAADAAEFLFIGELRRLKGVDVLLAALARLHGRGRKVRAVIVGDGPDGPAFRAQAAELGLAGTVSFTGALPAASAWPLGRIVVVPSRAESFPYVVLEAQAAGRPVIASRVGGIPEMLEEKWLVPPDDAAALAARMEEVLDSPSALAEARERIERLRRRFSVEAMSRGITAFYHSLLANRAAAA
jgi:glycosyltransferase involved in cell wall biosynthesis